MEIRITSKIRAALQLMKNAGLTTITEAQLYGFVQKNPGLTVSQIAAETGTPKATTSQSLVRLEKAGLIEYFAAGENRRDKRVRCVSS